MEYGVTGKLNETLHLFGEVDSWEKAVEFLEKHGWCQTRQIWKIKEWTKNGCPCCWRIHRTLSVRKEEFRPVSEIPSNVLYPEIPNLERQIRLINIRIQANEKLFQEAQEAKARLTVKREEIEKQVRELIEASKSLAAA